MKSVLLWSAIAAAFIGPGTVTTASLAGHTYGYSLLWALGLATVVCLILQEAVARISINADSDLPGVLLNLSKKNPAIRLFSILLYISVLIGCMAYEAGNLTGAYSGLKMGLPLDRRIYTAILVGLVFLLLYGKGHKGITTTLSALVALMGFSFLYLVFTQHHNFHEITSGFVPNFPDGSMLIVVGLVGTTIVPYNLFLGSGLSKGQNTTEMRFGLFTSIIIGGIISGAILVNGTLIKGAFSFQALGESLETSIGESGPWIAGAGLFFAGITSAITAPLAASMIVNGYTKNEFKTRITWMIVLFSGGIFCFFDFQPVPLIVMAQAVNGLILPLAVFLLWICLNDKETMRNRPATLWQNFSFGLASAISIVLGVNGITSQLEKYFGISVTPVLTGLLAGIIFLLTLLTVFWYRNYGSGRQEATIN